MFNSNEVLDTMREETFREPLVKNDDAAISPEQEEMIKSYRDFLFNGSATNQKYHFTEIKQAQTVIYWAMGILTGVTLFLCVMIGIILCTKSFDTSKDLIPIVTATIIDVLNVVVIGIINSFIKSKNIYFERSSLSEEFSKIIGLIQTVKDTKAKNAMINKIVDNYCASNSMPKKKS